MHKQPTPSGGGNKNQHEEIHDAGKTKYLT